MYECSKINRITVMYVSHGPGSYAGEKRKILGPEESQAICEEANRRDISIEMLLKSREPIESVVINTIVPFPQPDKPDTKEEEKVGEEPKEVKKTEEPKEEKKGEAPPPQN